MEQRHTKSTAFPTQSNGSSKGTRTRDDYTNSEILEVRNLLQRGRRQCAVVHFLCLGWGGENRS